ncbi:monovalent cation/H(+) antiporter subunit G [Phytoactinopolyspora alkaliphila]|uniref:Monovalent cation/H(+) antiporter subunit G n=1 Tax=Phytoactinopolyspora alkaliphila TaxID=1783498 RepID=A0A6N9YJ56_9ACTN|nr:monovalent cation/H(+) antiporter subunit G [Phytoactinopolyspora alkaliphila]NED95046.1 monovalent cation/H(+) antiporter subunit G [Phytoactinopolyspora alkaliphila]
MTWTGAADAVSAVLLLAGTALSLVAAIGALRFPDVLTRMHAATKPQTLGMLLILLALAFRLREPSVIGMLLAVALFQLLTAPVAAHMVARSAYRRRYFSDEAIAVDELAGTDGERP